MITSEVFKDKKILILGLGITGLKAKDIIPYTLIMMVVGFIIFTLGLLIF